MNKLILIAFLAVLSGCATQKRCSYKFPTENTRDSVYIESVKEIPIYLPGDSILVDVPINCPDQDIVNVETSKLKQIIKILNGKLISNTNLKPDTVYVPVIETKTVIKEVKVPEPDRKSVV